jgi:hypothetical protein
MEVDCSHWRRRERLQVRPTIDRVIAEWTGRHHRISIPLVVALSRSHGDHHQGAGDVLVSVRDELEASGDYVESP